MSQQLNPQQAALILNITNTFVGIACLIWMSTKNPRFRGGKPVGRLLRSMIAVLGLAMIGLGVYGAYHH